MSRKPPRVVVVTRRTEYEELLARHCTSEQARFFLESRGQSLDGPLAAYAALEGALAMVLQAVPLEWSRTRVDRGDLDRFLFAPDDIVVALGQDGLVANTAKYLSGQLVIGVNPDPARNEGVLVRHTPEATQELLHRAAAGSCEVERRTMVQVTLDDGQRLLALNEVFIGQRTHQSARYEIAHGGQTERQSSSGLIVSTGTGATGWARSVRRNRICDVRLPAPVEERLVFFVREAWPSVASGTSITDGSIVATDPLEVTSRMNEDGVIFGDGIEADRIEFDWGRQVSLGVADTRLHLVI